MRTSFSWLLGVQNCSVFDTEASHILRHLQHDCSVYDTESLFKIQRHNLHKIQNLELESHKHLIFFFSSGLLEWGKNMFIHIFLGIFKDMSKLQQPRGKKLNNVRIVHCRKELKNLDIAFGNDSLGKTFIAWPTSPTRSSWSAWVLPHD